MENSSQEVKAKTSKTNVQNGLKLRFKLDKSQRVSIGKFVDSIEWKDETTDKMYDWGMHIQQEDLKEEEITDEKELKKFRQRRLKYYYKKKNYMMLENLSSTSKPKFQGSIANFSLADVEYENKIISGEKNENEFNFVVLQFVRKQDPITGKEINDEINVIPVSEFYNFKKYSDNPDHLINEVEEKYVESIKQKKEKLSKYKNIFKALSDSEKKKLSESGLSEGGTIDALESDLFSNALNHAFGAKFRKGIASTSNIESKPQFLTENGINPDDLNEFDWCKGDFGSRFADDEEEYVTEVQGNLNQDIEAEMSNHNQGNEYDEEEEEEEEENEDEQEDEEEENEEEKKERDTLRILSEGTKLNQSKAYGRNTSASLGELQSPSSPTFTSSNTNALASASNAMKRARDESRQSQPPTENVATGTKSGLTLHLPTKKSKLANDILEEEGSLMSRSDIIRYFSSKGGKASHLEFNNEFKKRISSFASKKKGILKKDEIKKKLLEKLELLTYLEDDPQQGKCLVLISS